MPRINFREHTFGLRETDPSVRNHQGCATNVAILYQAIRGKGIAGGKGILFFFYFKKKQNKYI